MSVPAITAYAALANEYPGLTQALRAASAAEGAALTDSLERRARDLLAPLDHEMLAKALFNSLGFVVASPELLAQELAAHDGHVVNDVNGSHLPSYLAEATALATRLFEEALAKRLPVQWVSGATELETYVRLAQLLGGRPYLGIFRNQPPDLEQAVQLFQTPTHRIALDPNY